MPIVTDRIYSPGLLSRNRHFQIIYPRYFRKTDIRYEREEFRLPDGDFLDIDWIRTGSDKLLIILHGMESSSNNTAVRGMAGFFSSRGWDCAAVNMRGCSGRPNRKAVSYYAGSSDDLRAFISAVENRKEYTFACLAGYSLGGNITLKFLGEEGSKGPERSPRFIRAAAAISSPCNLGDAAKALNNPENRIYQKKFLNSFKKKITLKARMFPETVSVSGLINADSLLEYDNRYTAPMHGFSNAMEYYSKCSAAEYIKDIDTPCILISSEDDPFLTPSCFPEKEAENSEYFFLNRTRYGGHCGYISRNSHGGYWHDEEVLNFFGKYLIL